MRLLLIVFSLLSIVGCRSDEWAVEQAALSFVGSHEVLGAPFRAYTFITKSDKATVRAEDFERVFPPNPIFAGGEVKVLESELNGDTARVLVRVQNLSADAMVEYSYLFQKEDKSWRVNLGLSERNKILSALSRAENLAKEGNLDEARNIHLELTRAPMSFSRPGTLQDRADALDLWLTEKERVAELGRRIAQLRPLNGSELREGLDTLSRELEPGDEELAAQIKELRQVWRTQYIAGVFDKLAEPRFRLRRVNRSGNLERELMVWLTNSSSHSIVDGHLLIKYLNGEDVISEKRVRLPSGASIPADQEREFVFALDPSPEEWKGREITMKWDAIELPEVL